MPSVLIVESDENLCTGIMQGLSGSYATLRARTSSEALEMVRNNNGIDVLLCDLAVPYAAGSDVVQKIRSENKEIPLIVLGSHSSARQICEAMRHGASTFLLKPLNIPLLEQAIETAVKKKRASAPGTT